MRNDGAKENGGWRILLGIRNPRVSGEFYYLNARCKRRCSFSYHSYFDTTFEYSYNDDDLANFKCENYRTKRDKYTLLLASRF